MTRHCGPCAACCTADPVRSSFDDRINVNKPAGTRCPYQCGGDTPARGMCSVHEEKPRCCAIYMCAWLDGFGAEEDRPDLAGVIAEVARDALGRPRLAFLGPAPGFSETDPGFVAAIAWWRGADAVVATPTQVIADPEQMEWLRTVEMRLADGAVLRFAEEP